MYLSLRQQRFIFIDAKFNTAYFQSKCFHSKGGTPWPLAKRLYSTTEDADIVVIGGGPGGYVAAIKAAQLGMKVSGLNHASFLEHIAILLLTQFNYAVHLKFALLLS